jgi:cobalt-zinc-cadmium efflux system protein
MVMAEHHHHHVGPDADRRPLLVALDLIVAFMAAEVTAGLAAGSLALLSDAAHMVTDAGALLLALVALRLAGRPPAGGLTYGLKRSEILSALANGVTLFVLAAVIVFEAIRRLLQPPQVDGRLMLGVALAGIAVNLLATWQLARSRRRSLNVRASYQHLLTDLYAFLGTAVAAGVIIVTGFVRADPIASLLVAALMVRAAYGLVRDATRVLLEAAPAGMSAPQVAQALARHPQVVDVHDFHLWEITSGMPALSAHILVRPGADCHAVRRELERTLSQRFGISHSTLQLDHSRTPGEGLITVQPARAPGAPRPARGRRAARTRHGAPAPGQGRP